MNILLVSQCDKGALTETRRILDQFAERRGDRTWQTPITRAGCCKASLAAMAAADDRRRP